MVAGVWLMIIFIQLVNYSKVGSIELGVIGFLVTILGALVIRYEWWFKRWMKSVESSRLFDNEKNGEMYDKLSRSIDKLNGTISNHNATLASVGEQITNVRDLARAAIREASANTSNLSEHKVEFAKLQTMLSDFIGEMKKDRATIAEILREHGAGISKNSETLSNLIQAHNTEHKGNRVER